jgi:hypothetical protein
MGMGVESHAPAALSLGMTRYTLCRRLGGPQGRSGRMHKSRPPTGIRFPNCPACSDSAYRLSYPGPPGNTKSYLQEHSIPERARVN